MKLIGILLIITGLLGFALAGLMFDDIGFAAIICAFAAFFPGIGFFMTPRAIKKAIDKQPRQEYPREHRSLSDDRKDIRR